MELVSTAGAVAASSDMGFMIKGLIKYELFGQELWITTTHVSILIVDIVLILFFLAVKKKMKNPSDIPDAFQNIAELINGIGFHIFVMAQPIDLRPVYIVMRIQRILCDAPILHRLPEAIIFYHLGHTSCKPLDFFLLSP